jgi:hypothetical protein
MDVNALPGTLTLTDDNLLGMQKCMDDSCVRGCSYHRFRNNGMEYSHLCINVIIIDMRI